MRRPFTVVASVGTYHHPFNRFVDWLEPWTAAHQAKVVFQHGSTRPIEGAENHEMLDPASLLDHYRSADVVVLQGGAGGFMDARKAGRIPIVVPRIPVDDEVVDDHQVVLSRRLAEMGLIHVAETQEDLDRLLAGVLDGSVPSRLASQRPTKGVSEAVRLLNRPAGGPRPAAQQSLERRSTVSPTGPSRPVSEEQPFGEHYLRASDERPHRSLRASVRGAVQQGLLGYVASFVAGLVTLRQLSVGEPTAAVTTASIALWLAYSFCALPAYERARSLVPMVRFVAAAGIVLLVLVLAGVTDVPDLRQGVTAALVAAGFHGAAALLNRRVLRRRRTVVVGEQNRSAELVKRWQSDREIEVVATCFWRQGAERIPAGAIGSIDRVVPEVMGAVARHRATTVVVAADAALTSPALRHLAWAMERVGVESVVLTDLNDHVEYIRPRHLAGQVVLGMRPPNHHLVSAGVKSGLDRLAAAAALVVLLPLLLLVGLAVRLDSPGPVVFRQVRTGRDGRPFTMLKFRTMTADAEERLADLALYNEGAGPLFKLTNDPRITRVGRFLRRSSLDELPQLVNVLRGSMSFVGPRPALPTETAEYSEWMWRRLHVRPGITGLWQVSGRSRLTWEESIRVDLQYVNTWSLWLDAQILLRTFGAVVTRDGAL